MEELLEMNIGDSRLDDNVSGNNNDLLSITSVDNEELNVDDTGTPNAGGYYRRVWNVADHPAAGEDLPTMKTITVIVTWENNAHRVSITSLRI
jgi:hypothetical protein